MEKITESRFLAVHRMYEVISLNGEFVEDRILIEAFNVSEGWFDAHSVDPDRKPSKPKPQTRRHQMRDYGINPSVQVSWRCGGIENKNYLVAVE